MKKILAFLIAGLLAGAGAASALTSANSPVRPDRSTPNSVPAATSPEPLTIIALASGAALAGGLSRRRRRR